jgi:hypothetical protein
VGSDAVRVHIQADACALFDIHPAVIFHPEALLDVALTELSRDPRASIVTAKCRTDGSPDSVFCLDTVIRTTPAASEYGGGGDGLELFGQTDVGPDRLPSHASRCPGALEHAPRLACGVMISRRTTVSAP